MYICCFFFFFFNSFFPHSFISSFSPFPLPSIFLFLFYRYHFLLSLPSVCVCMVSKTIAVHCSCLLHLLPWQPLCKPWMVNSRVRSGNLPSVVPCSVSVFPMLCMFSMAGIVKVWTRLTSTFTSRLELWVKTAPLLVWPLLWPLSLSSQAAVCAQTRQ